MNILVIEKSIIVIFNERGNSASNWIMGFKRVSYLKYRIKGKISNILSYDLHLFAIVNVLIFWTNLY